jgi:L-threonylcarbamoyladenylate synthase
MIVTPTDENIQKAADVLREGGLIGLPTETVYVLAGNAYSDEAVQKIYAAKGRPSFNPLIVHYAETPTCDAPHYQQLAQSFWPGPLTLIIPKPDDSEISEIATAGLETMAVRVPKHPVAQQLLKAIDFPLVAPSANPSGMLSPTTPAHVADGLGDKVDLILAAGQCHVGVESTVLDITSDMPTILRPGAITAQDIANALHCDVLNGDKVDDIKSPGQLLKHYAPNTPVRLNAIDVESDEALLAFGSTKFMSIKSGGGVDQLPDGQMMNLSESGDLYEAAANLFAMLKTLDGGGFKRIAVMNIPDEGIGIAINDRLKRAAQS